MRVLSLFDGISTGQYCLKKLNIDVENYYASEIDKNAIAITQYNFPNTIQLGDVNKWKEWDIDWSKIDLLIGGSPCFVAGTLVMTDKGMKPIEEIKVGDMVLTHKSHYKKVLNVGAKLVDTVYNVKGMGFDTLTTTANHPFYVREKYYQYEDKGRKRKEGWKAKSRVRHYKDPEWIEAKDLDVSKHYLGTTYNTELSDDTDTHSEDFWYFVGRFVGDGWVQKTKRIHRKNSFLYAVKLCCGKAEYDEVKTIMDKLGYNYNCSEEKTTYKFYITNMDLMNYLSLCGHGAINKCVHPDVWKLSKNKKKAFLDGYISADGSYIKNSKYIYMSTISKRLAYELKLLIAEVYNTPVTLTYSIKNPTHIIENRVVNQHNCYVVKFKKTPHIQDKSFYDNETNYIWTQLTSVNTENKNTMVYNLEVEEDNSYTANGVVVHNCQNLSNSGNGMGLEGSESSLFFKYVEIMNHIKSVNPNLKFLLENVKMKTDWQKTFDELMGVKPILIDSALVSAQSRKRLYWTNIAENIEQPEDKQIFLKDIVEPREDKEYCHITDKMYAKKDGTLSYKKAWGAVRTLEQKSKTLTCSQSIANSGATNIKYPDGEFYKPTPIEEERLQTLPDNYTKYGIFDGITKEMKYGPRVKAVGNGWTADVIIHIFKKLL